MTNWFRFLICSAITVVFLGASALVAFSNEPENRSLGGQLYEKMCSGCHSPLNESIKAGRSVGRIRSAIRMFGQHKAISALSDEQINMIALALKEIKF